MDINGISWWMLDGAILLIILIFAFAGRRNGVAESLIKLAGLAAGLVLGVMFTGKLAEWLGLTPLNDLIYNKILDSLNAKTDNVTDGMPAFIGDAVDSVAQKTNEALALKYTDGVINVMSFLIIVFAVWLIAWLLRRAFHLGKKGSVVLGGIDGLAGFAFGGIKGFIIVCLLVALLLPVTTLVAPLKLLEMKEALDESVIAGWIYDVNPLLVFVKHIIA